jgi:hypothetical protein
VSFPPWLEVANCILGRIHFSAYFPYSRVGKDENVIPQCTKMRHNVLSRNALPKSLRTSICADGDGSLLEVAVLQKKLGAAVVLRKVLERFQRRTGNTVKKIRFDRASEFYSLKDWMAEQGIMPQPVQPDSTGRALRLNRTLLYLKFRIICTPAYIATT